MVQFSANVQDKMSFNSTRNVHFCQSVFHFSLCFFSPAQHFTILLHVSIRFLCCLHHNCYWECWKCVRCVERHLHFKRPDAIKPQHFCIVWHPHLRCSTTSFPTFHYLTLYLQSVCLFPSINYHWYIAWGSPAGSRCEDEFSILGMKGNKGLVCCFTKPLFGVVMGPGNIQKELNPF